MQVATQLVQVSRRIEPFRVLFACAFDARRQSGFEQGKTRGSERPTTLRKIDTHSPGDLQWAILHIEHVID